MRAERRFGRLHCGASRRRPSAQSIWICAPWSADAVPSSRHEGAFQPSFPTLNLYVAGYCWLSYSGQCRQAFRQGWDRGPRSPISARGRTGARVLDCLTGQHERGLNRYQLVAATLSDGGRRCS